MQCTVKLVCAGVKGNTHKPRTIAQFRYDDAWVRVHDRKKRDQIVWEPDGTAHGSMSMAHLIACDHAACTRADPRYMLAEKLYPALDYARDRGETELLLR